MKIKKENTYSPHENINSNGGLTSNGVNHTKNIIEVKNVSFSYGKNQVLKNITFNIHQGDYLAIVGPNGAGKTTLLKLILGLLPLKEGTINLFGYNLKEFKNWPSIGYVPQKVTNFDANFPVTVEEVVLMGRFSAVGLLKRTAYKDRQLVDKALEQVGMQEYKNHAIGSLSGGQQQRVFIARALAGQPKIIFLDEPTTGVDKVSQDNFYNLLKELNQSLSLTIVLISHDIDRVTKEAMHIACVDHTLISHGSAQEFLQHSQSVNIDGQQKIIDHYHP